MRQLILTMFLPMSLAGCGATPSSSTHGDLPASSINDELELRTLEHRIAPFIANPGPLADMTDAKFESWLSFMKLTTHVTPFTPQVDEGWSPEYRARGEQMFLEVQTARNAELARRASTRPSTRPAG